MLAITNPRRITIFNILPLLIGGAAMLQMGAIIGASIFGGGRNKNNNDDKRDLERKSSKRVFKQIKREC